MQTVSWLAYGISNALTRTVVHFYPSAGNVTAPYPALCRLSVFGEGLSRETVTIEGVRLSQPDGIRVEDAFPALKEGSAALYGLSIDLAINQARMDLSESLCVIELSSRIQSARFWPVRLPEIGENTIATVGSALALKDGYATTSLVAVNASDQSFEPGFRYQSSKVDKDPCICPVSLAALPPDSAREFDLEEAGEAAFYGEATVQELGWGLARTRSLQLEPPKIPGQVYYILYRDAVTRRPVSVSAL